MTIKTIIIEDEFHARDRLKKILKNYKEIHLIGEASNGEEAVQLINESAPDLIFLDIQMPKYTGFEVLKKLTVSPYIVFVTAFDQFAIQAFEKNAVDYILKPFTSERIGESIRRVQEREGKHNSRMLGIMKSLLEKPSYQRQFAAKMGEEITIIPESEILYFQAEDKYVLIYTEDRKYFIDKTLKELEELIDPEIFFRIHRSSIVSLPRIRKIKKWFHSSLIVQLSDPDKTKLKVSRGYQQALKEKIQF